MDDMRERVLQIMHQNGFSPSQFAEKIGIQRATMSHIINGRSNPSIDVYKKVIESFADIDPDWLLSGKGNMKRGVSTTQRTLFDNTPENPPKVQVAAEKRPEIEVEKPQNVLQPIVQKEVIIQKIEPKNISKILIFYSDNTFDTFVLEKVKKEI